VLCTCIIFLLLSAASHCQTATNTERSLDMRLHCTAKEKIGTLSTQFLKFEHVNHLIAWTVDFFQFPEDMTLTALATKMNESPDEVYIAGIF
jgi:hypothetical protein